MIKLKFKVKFRKSLELIYNLITFKYKLFNFEINLK